MRYISAFLAIVSLYGQGGVILAPPMFKTVNGGTPSVGSITLTKTASPLSGISSVGTVITYTYTIKNTGAIGLQAPFTINDNKQGVINPCGLVSGTLAPNATTSCTSTHATTQADLDAGTLTNTAQASNQSISSGSVPATVTFTQLPAITVSKVSNPQTFNAANTVLRYTYTVTNTGNVTLRNAVSITDTKAGTLNACGNPTIAPQGTSACTLAYTTTAADLTAGFVTNTVTAATTFGATNLSATATLTVTSGIDITNVPGGHGLTNAVCDDVHDDSSAIQGTLNYAYSIATPSAPVTVTGPNNKTCLTAVWNTIPAGNGFSVLNLPSYVNFIGAGTIGNSTPFTLDCAHNQPANTSPCVNVGYFQPTWKSSALTFYNVQNTSQDATFIPLASPFPSAGTFNVGDYVALYNLLPTCGGSTCDTMPFEVWKVASYSASTGHLNIAAAANNGAPATLAWSFTNGAFTYNNGVSVIPNQLSIVNITQSCSSNVNAGANCHYNAGGSLQNMTILSAGQIAITESIGFVMDHVHYDNSTRFVDQMNSVEWMTFTNNNMTCSGCTSSGFNIEFMQRSSGSNLVSNNVFGSASQPWGGLSNAEFPHGETWSGNTIYAVAGFGNPTTVGDSGMNNTVTGNSIIVSGALNNSPGQWRIMADADDNGADADPCGTKCYAGRTKITNNTITGCAGVAGNACIQINGQGTTVSGNIVTISGSAIYAIAYRDPGTGTGRSFDGNVSNNTIHLGPSGIGVYNPGNMLQCTGASCITGPDNWVINNNKIDNPGGGTDNAIVIGTPFTQTSGSGCSVTGNTIGPADNIVSPMVANRTAVVTAHPTCVIQTN